MSVRRAAVAVLVLLVFPVAGGCRRQGGGTPAEFPLPDGVVRGRDGRLVLDPSVVREQVRERERGRRDAGADPKAAHEAALNELARQKMLSGERAGLIIGEVRDAATDRPLHSRVLVRDGGLTEPGALLRSVGFWSDGRFRLPALAGVARLTVSAGRRRSVASPDVLLKPGRRAKVRVDLRQPSVLRFEERGWVGVDLFRPVAGGEVLRCRPTLEVLALAARAEGVAFVGAARPWSTEGFTRGGDDLERVRAECRRLSERSNGTLTITPAGTGSDAPLYGAMFHVGAGGPSPIAPGVWDVTRPNFLAMTEVRRKGGIAVLRGIADARELDPRAEVVAIRRDLAELYGDAPVALSNIACELPFDVVAGVLPDALALSGSEAEAAVWFRLLDMGYRLPAVHVEGGSLAGGVIPAERTFVKVRAAEDGAADEGAGETGPEAAPGVEDVIAAVRGGRVMASNGAFVFLTVGGRGPGAVFKADGAPQPVRIEVYSSTLKDDRIARVELLRNGEVLESVPGLGRSMVAATLSVREAETAWYIARVRSGPGGERFAWTSPVYFEGPQHSPPRPVATRVHGLVTDSATASPLAAVVKAYLGGKLLAEAASDPKTGAYEIKCTPAARLEVNAKGYVAASTHVFFHTGAPSVIRAIHTNESGKGAAVLAEEATYERMRLAAGEAKIPFSLKPWPATTP